MPSEFERKAKELAHHLQEEIGRLEHELAGKKDMLDKLLSMYGGRPELRRGRRPGRKPAIAAIEKAPARRGRATGRRKSKNRDLVLEAAQDLPSKFKLHELQEKILSIDPKFGRKHPLGTILSVLKTTPEIKRVRRGLYKYSG